MQDNSSLQYLNLSGNEIGPQGAEALSGALRTHKAIVSLNLNWNNLGATWALVLYRISHS